MACSKLNVPYADELNVAKKITKLYNRYLALRKSKSKLTSHAEMNREMFVLELREEIFEIAPRDLQENPAVYPEDKAFYSLQQEDRMSSSVGGVDKNTTGKNLRRVKGKEAEARRKRKHDEEMAQKQNLEEKVEGIFVR